MRKLDSKTKQAKGTHRKAREKGTVVFKGVDDVTPPEQLSDDAKEIWREIATTISDDKLLTVVDRRLLMSYCNETAKYWKLTKDLENEDWIIELYNKDGQVVNSMKNQKLDMCDKALANAHRIGMHFGLTPLSRSKIPMPKKREKSPEQLAKDKLESLRSNKGKLVKMA